VHPAARILSRAAAILFQGERKRCDRAVSRCFHLGVNFEKNALILRLLFVGFIHMQRNR
jgi:hypothetical protein